MIRLLLLGTLMATLTFEGYGQGVRWSIGTDPGLWASGWRNVQLGAQVNPEFSLIVGAGAVQNGQGMLPSLLRPRPAGFERGWLSNVGFRFHPATDQGRRVQALLGFDYQMERYHLNVSSVLLPEGAELAGIQQFERTDLRMLVGGRFALVPRLTLSAHVGLGYNLRSGDDWIDAGRSTIQHPSMPRMIGMELMLWL